MYLRSIPVLRYFILLVVGIYLYQWYQPQLGQIYIFISTVFLLGILSTKINKLRFLKHTIPFLFLGLGLASSHLFDQKNQENYISKVGKFDKYMAMIDSYTESKPKTYKVTAKIFAVKKGSKWKNVVGETMLYFNKEANTVPKYGEIYVLKNTIREIEAPKNPFEFDYKTYQARKNIFNHQFLREGDFLLAGEMKGWSLLKFANSLNVYTHTVFKEILDTPKQMGVAEAMIGGMKAELDFETKQWYSATGAIHVLAVSGMHVVILFVVLNKLLGLFLDKKKPFFLATILILLWSYAIFTGLSPSVCRSTLMFSMIQLGTFFRRDDNPVNTLLLSAIILLIIVPTWLYDVGFQLSYLAVLGIMVIYPSLKRLFYFKWKPIRWIWEISAVSIAAQIFTLPLTLYYFHQFPNYFLLANPVVSLVSSFMLPIGLLVLFIAKIPYLGAALGLIFQWLIDILNYSVYLISKLPNALTVGLSISITTVILLFLIIAFVLLFFKNKEVIYIKLIAITCLFLTISGANQLFKQNKQKEITFHFIPNGWGISVIEGRSATFISTDSLCNEPLIYQFHLKNYYDAKGIKNYKTQKVADQGNFIINNNLGNIQWMKTPNGKIIKKNTPYLVCTENAIKDLTNLSEFDGTIILDGSNKKWVVEKIKAEAEQKKKKLVILYDTGSKTLTF
jgi:competence protein ComEC